jgi:hypothetical protein
MVPNVSGTGASGPAGRWTGMLALERVSSFGAAMNAGCVPLLDLGSREKEQEKCDQAHN